MKPLTRKFYARKAEIVSKDLLGKILMRKYKGKILKAKIVETEAYYGREDPASRACKNGDIRETMLARPGTILVYGVHNNWLINIVTGKKEKAEAVLLRAIEPINFHADMRGPGKLTKAMHIEKKFHNKDITNCKELLITEGKKPRKIVSSHRIGIKKDLPKNLRFYIEKNKFVSKL